MISLLQNKITKRDRKIDFQTLETTKVALHIYHERGIDAVMDDCPAYFEHVVEIAHLLCRPRTGRSVAQLSAEHQKRWGKG